MEEESRTLKVFVDANILFSAAYSEDKLQRTLLLLGPSKGLSLVTSDYAVDETLRNLHRKASLGAEHLLPLLKACAIIPTPTHGEVPPSLPAKDHPIWLSAVRSGCDVLLTGDRKDFGKLKHPKFRVLGPRQLFDELFRQ